MTLTFVKKFDINEFRLNEPMSVTQHERVNTEYCGRTDIGLVQFTTQDCRYGCNVFIPPSLKIRKWDIQCWCIEQDLSDEELNQFAEAALKHFLALPGIEFFVLRHQTWYKNLQAQ